MKGFKLGSLSSGLVLTSVFVDMFGLGLIVPNGPELVRSISDGNVSQGALAYGLVVAIFAATQFLCAPFLGALSDRIGRKPVLVGSLAILACDYLVFAAAQTVLILFISRAIAGACSGAYTAVNAYIADTTDGPARTRAFGRMGAAFSLGFILGPSIGGLLGSVDIRLPFLIASGLAFANALFGLLFIKESKNPDKTVPLKFSVVNPVTSFGRLATDGRIKSLVWIRVLSEVANQGFQATWVLYLGYRFHWSIGEIGLLYAVSAIAGTVVSSLLVGPLTKVMGNKGAFILGTSAQLLTFAGSAVIVQSWMLYPLMIIGSLAGLSSAVIQSSISSRIPTAEQGKLQGGLTSLSSLAEMIVPLVGTALFAWSISPASPIHIPAIALWLSCLALGGALTLAIVPAYRRYFFLGSAEAPAPGALSSEASD